MKVDVSAAPRAKRPELCDDGFAADGAGGPQSFLHAEDMGRKAKDTNGSPFSQSVQPAEVDGITLTAEQRHGVIERQTNHVGKRSDDLHYETARDTLRRVSAGFAAPFSGRKIGFDVFFRQPLEANPGLDVPLPRLLVRREQTNSRMDAMITAGQKAQTLRRLIEQFRLGQNAASDRDHGIGGENESAFKLFIGAYHGQCGLGLAS